jgi:fatty acid desaturase
LLRFPALQFRLHLRPRLVAIRLKRRAFFASSKTPSSESLTPIMNAVIEMDLREFSVAPVEVEAKAESQTGRWLRYKVDRRAVTMVSVMLGLHVAVFLLAPTWIAALCVIPFTVASMFIAAINHHHQHFNTFHSSWMNRVYDIALSLQTGIAPYGWVLHHNLGHHVNYLNQRPHPQPDESKWTRRDGSQMGRIEYTIDLLLHHQIDIVRVGRRYPKYLRAFLWMKLPLWSIIGLALYVNPTNAVLVILLPGFLTLIHTSWVTYGHHAGLYPTNHYDASVNCINPLFNYLSCNLGYHTAHHKRPGVHWSLLPKIHAEIEHRIPPEQIETTFF